MRTLNFNKDYNHKLSLNYFTTIRSWATIYDKDLYPNNVVKLTLSRVPRGYAAVMSITPLDLSVPFRELSPIVATLLSIDTGLPPVDAYYEIKKKVGERVALVMLGK